MDNNFGSIPGKPTMVTVHGVDRVAFDGHKMCGSAAKTHKATEPEENLKIWIIGACVSRDHHEAGLANRFIIYQGL
jgi:hypothetical protein